MKKTLLGSSIKIALLALTCATSTHAMANLGSGLGGKVDTVIDKQQNQLEALSQTMHKKLLANNGSMIVDYSDSEQKAYIEALLAHVGKNTANSPQLFKMLDQAEQQHIKQKTSKQVGISSTSEIHNSFLAFDFVTEKNDPEELLLAKALSTVEGGTNMTLMLLQVSDLQGKQLTEPGFVQVFADGKRNTVYSRTNLQNIAAKFPDQSLARLTLTAIVETPDGLQTTEVKTTQMDLTNAFNAANRNNPGIASGNYDIVPTRTHPKDGANGSVPDGFIQLCLNRNHQDCDYHMNQGGQGNDETYVLIPFQGSYSVPHRIEKIYGPNEVVESISSKTGIWVNTKENGVTAELVNDLGKSFYDYLSFENFDNENRAVITWNIPRDEGKFGKATLFDRYEDVDWEMHIVVKAQLFYNPFLSQDIDFVSDTQDHEFSSFFVETFEPLRFAYSCIAKGSLVTMADGSHKKIEDIAIGDLVKANGVDLQVVDTSIGKETIPMYRIVDENGNSMLLTESHPVKTMKKGIVWANELEAGDTLYTEKGHTRVAKVSQEMFNDHVYNLKLGKTEGMASMPDDANAFFVNGMQVYDLAEQARHEYKHNQETTEEEVLRKLPNRWHQDYLNSKK